MKDNTLRTLLKEYEKKRLNASLALDKRVSDLYAFHPRLAEIEHQLNTFGVQVAKHILSASSEQEIEQLKQKIFVLKQEREALLKELSIDPSFFEPSYECSYCQDTGYIQEGTNYSLCPCIKQKLFNIDYNKANIGNLEKDNFEHFDITLYADTIDEAQYHSNISPRENINHIVTIAKHFIENFENPEQKNLLFTGSTGLGKTFLSNCIANELLKKGKTVLYQTAPTMLDTIIDYRFNKGTVSEETYNSILEVDLLIIDDLGTEHMNGLKFAELFNIINSRLLNQNHHITKTIISTNLSLQNLNTTYDERIFSRFVGYYDICRFFGTDIRFKK